MRLKDKVIVVTGATTGIGRAIAERCAAEGSRVLVHGINREEGAEVVAGLGKSAFLHIDDLVDPESPGRIVAAALSAFGRIDAVVNNASIVPRSTIETTTAALFDRTMAINVRAALLLIQAAMPHLRKARGCVLNIGSINALSGEATLLDYSISKGALQTLSRNLANAHTLDQVRVNHFNVGWVLSPREYQHQRDQGLPADWPERVPPVFAPSGRLIKPEEIASAAVFWLSDESRPVTGSVVELEQFSLFGRNPVKT
jgi:NAD(P)-dependent dehydrogenase (short-subunit alcohol dehydrogenase family)